jgi:hypothetical protein
MFEGLETQNRDLNTGIRVALHATNASGGIQERNVLGLISHQTTSSYRTHGARGLTADSPGAVLQLSDQSIRWPYDKGHEYSTVKVSQKDSHPDYTARGAHNSYYRGPLNAVDVRPFWDGYNGPNAPRVTFPLPSFEDSRGVHAMRQTLPAKSAANLSQLILETLLDMPKIPFDRIDTKLYNRSALAKNISDEYLNVVFGWAPFVSDVLKICEAIVKIDDTLTQYVRDAGRVVRRRFDWPTETTESSELLSANSRLGWPNPNDFSFYEEIYQDETGTYPFQSNGFLSTRGTVTRTTKLDVTYNFVGAWTYWLDDDSSLFNSLRRVAFLARKGLGIRADLELLWELAPWTWLSDWFVNIGDLLAVNNALANDSTVLRYGYLTRKIQSSVTYTHSGVLFGGRTYTGPISNTFTQRNHERVRATPYGFGIDLSALTPQQAAILVALGFTSKDPRRF